MGKVDAETRVSEKAESAGESRFPGEGDDPGEDAHGRGDLERPGLVQEEAAADVGQDGNEGERQPGGPEPGFLPQVMNDEETKSIA